MKKTAKPKILGIKVLVRKDGPYKNIVWGGSSSLPGILHTDETKLLGDMAEGEQSDHVWIGHNYPLQGLEDIPALMDSLRNKGLEINEENEKEVLKSFRKMQRGIDQVPLSRY